MYGTNIEQRHAADVTFELASSDDKGLEEAAMILRHHINNSMQNSKEMPWPPTAVWLLSYERQSPPVLKESLSFVVTGKSQTHSSD